MMLLLSSVVFYLVVCTLYHYVKRRMIRKHIKGILSQIYRTLIRYLLVINENFIHLKLIKKKRSLNVLTE